VHCQAPPIAAVKNCLNAYYATLTEAKALFYSFFVAIVFLLLPGQNLVLKDII
jgi:hypothetical protein